MVHKRIGKWQSGGICMAVLILCIPRDPLFAHPDMGLVYFYASTYFGALLFSVIWRIVFLRRWHVKPSIWAFTIMVIIEAVLGAVVLNLLNPVTQLFGMLILLVVCPLLSLVFLRLIIGSWEKTGVRSLILGVSYPMGLFLFFVLSLRAIA